MSLANQSITPFDFQGKEVRAIPHGDEFWFLATDVCGALEVKDVSRALDRLDDDEKGTTLTSTPGGKQNVSIISESGLYALVLSSRKPVAKPFKRWITHDVLPALRKTGKYEMQLAQAATPLDALEQMLVSMRVQESRLQLLEGSQVELEHRLDDTPISAHADKERHIQTLIKELAELNGGGTYNYKTAYGRFKSAFRLPGPFRTLKVSEYPAAVKLLAQWLDDTRRDHGHLYN